MQYNITQPKKSEYFIFRNDIVVVKDVILSRGQISMLIIAYTIRLQISFKTVYLPKFQVCIYKIIIFPNVFLLIIEFMIRI